jgi:uncharacterized protein YbaR (Trm112 family)
MMEEALDVDLDGRPPSIFGDPLDPEDHRWPDLFVLMPFDQELKPVFEDHVKPVAERAGLTVGRADDFFSTQSIVREVWSAIVYARLVLADCTGRNPNVFYEIGIAHTLGKNTVLVAQSIDDVPFDLRHLRVIVYEYTPRGMTAFEKQLSATLGGPQSLALHSERSSDDSAPREIRDSQPVKVLHRSSPGAAHALSPAAELYDLLVCPRCKVRVIVTPDGLGLRCDNCHRIYPILDGIPVMLAEEARIDSGETSPLPAKPVKNRNRKERPGSE